MMRGILRLGEVNEDEEIEKLLMNAIRQKKKEFKDAFVVQGAILYLSNHSIDNEEGRKLLFSFLEQLETTSVVESLDKDVNNIIYLQIFLSIN